MAEFNPRVAPTQDPSYLGLSKPITQPQADLSTATAIKGITDIGSTAIKGVDSVVKSNIDDQVYEGASRERDVYTATLEQNAGITPDKSGLTDGMEMSSQNKKPMNLMGDKADVPGAVANIGGYARSLQNALAAGNVSNTYYHARLSALASSIRSQYPGYREYIDKEIASVTGVNPANAYVSSLVGELNHLIGGKTNSEEKAIDALFMKEDVMQIPGIDGWYQKWKNKEVSAAEVYSHVNQAVSFEYGAKVRKDNLDIKKNRKEDVQELAGVDLSTNAAQTVQTYMNNFSAHAGLTVKQNYDKLVNSVIQGRTPDSVEARQIGMSINAVADRAEAEIRANAAKITNGSSMAMLAGGQKKADEIIAAEVAPMRAMAQWAMDKNVGAAFAAKNYIDAKKDQATNKLLGDPKLGGSMALISAVEALAPNSTGTLLTSLLAKGLPVDLATYVSDQQMKFTAQPNQDAGTIYTVYDSVVHAKNEKVKNDKVFQNLVDSHQQLLKPGVNDVGKTNIAEALFSPKNRGLLNEFGRDGDKGPGTWGRDKIFENYTGVDVAKEIKRLSGADSKIGENYVEWVKESFSNDIFRSDLNNLRGFRKDPTMKILWNDENKQWVFNKPEGATSAYVQDIEKTVTRVNRGLAGVKRVADGMGFEVEPFVIDAMRNAGLDVAKNRNEDSVSGEMLRTMINKKFQEWYRTQPKGKNAPAQTFD